MEAMVPKQNVSLSNCFTGTVFSIFNKFYYHGIYQIIILLSFFAELKAQSQSLLVTFYHRKSYFTVHFG